MQLTSEERFKIAKDFERYNLDEILERSNQTIRFTRNTYQEILRSLDLCGVFEYSIKHDPQNKEGFVLYTDLSCWEFTQLYNIYERIILEEN
jgi:hypothetical protein